jgi:hypothetical protein
MTKSRPSSSTAKAKGTPLNHSIRPNSIGPGSRIRERLDSAEAAIFLSSQS